MLVAHSEVSIIFELSWSPVLFSKYLINPNFDFKHRVLCFNVLTSVSLSREFITIVVTSLMIGHAGCTEAADSVQPYVFVLFLLEVYVSHNSVSGQMYFKCPTGINKAL